MAYFDGAPIICEDLVRIQHQVVFHFQRHEIAQLDVGVYQGVYLGRVDLQNVSPLRFHPERDNTGRLRGGIWQSHHTH